MTEEEIIEAMALAFDKKRQSLIWEGREGSHASTEFPVREPMRAAYAIARKEIERRVVDEIMEPTPEMGSVGLTSFKVHRQHYPGPECAVEIHKTMLRASPLYERVYEEQTSDARLVKYRWQIKPDWKVLFAFKFPASEYEFYVPEGTIKRGFSM